jgi:class 3 adenylate cyclase
MNAFRPFFPRLLLDRATGLDTSGPALILPGACLFADVSGFTAMSEALLAMGKEGSEVLTKVLNGFYAELVEAALANGGDVMRFAGDAVTVHFPDEATALRAGLAMQGLMPRFCSIPTPAGEFTLRMKAGVATGEAHFFLVEGAGRRDYVYSGDPVDGSAEAEHHAEAGEVVAKRGVGFDKILDASGESKPPDTQGELASGDILAPFLHPLLWEALAAG